MGDKMREKLEWKTVKNPRKENGDLGDLECSFCKCQTGGYVVMGALIRICKGCLYDGINSIDKTILSCLPKNYKD